MKTNQLSFTCIVSCVLQKVLLGNLHNVIFSLMPLFIFKVNIQNQLKAESGLRLKIK